MVAEYFREIIYTPWRWYKKQELVKRHCQELKKKDELPDFHKIMMEKHKDDKAGYDILFINPINKGNYSSRFSHSCDPNSGTTTTMTKEKYLPYFLGKSESGKLVNFCADKRTPTKIRNLISKKKACWEVPRFGRKISSPFFVRGEESSNLLSNYAFSKIFFEK